MAKQRRIIAIVAISTAAIIAAVLVYSLHTSNFGKSAIWGRGRITVSERYYCKNTFRKILDIWRLQAANARIPRSGGLIESSYDSYLVIDTAAPTIGHLQQHLLDPQPQPRLQNRPRRMIALSAKTKDNQNQQTT